MKKYFLIGIVMCLAHIVFSQSDYRRGYVIKNSKDTLFGLVNYREGRVPYKSCDFKTSRKAEATVYLPGDIEGYGFDGGKYFQSREIHLKHEDPQTVFVQVIVKGLVSLYRFHRHFLVEKDHDGLQHLVNERRDVQWDGTHYRKDNHEYVGILNMLLFDCVEVRGRLPKVELKEKSLANIIEAYNACSGEKFITFKARKPWLTIRPGIIGGVNISKMELAVPGAALTPLVFQKYRAPMAGISINLSSPRVSERISFNADLFYASSKYYGFNMSQNSIRSTRDYTTIELSSLRIPLAFRYTLPERKITPYVNGGISVAYRVGITSTVVREVESNSTVDTYYDPGPVPGRYQLGVWGGVGALFRLWHLEGFSELRYEKMPDVTNAPVKTTMTGIQAIIGIRTTLK